MVDPRPDAYISEKVTVFLGALCVFLVCGIVVYFVVKRLRHRRKKLFAICLKVFNIIYLHK